MISTLLKQCVETASSFLMLKAILEVIELKE